MRVTKPLSATQLVRPIQAPRLMRKALKKLTYERHPIITMDVNPVQYPEIRGRFRVPLEEVI